MNEILADGAVAKVILTDIFHIGGIGYDVTLSSHSITWKTLGDTPKSNFFKKRS